MAGRDFMDGVMEGLKDGTKSANMLSLFHSFIKTEYSLDAFFALYRDFCARYAKEILGEDL